MFILCCGWMVGGWIEKLRYERCWLSCLGPEKITKRDLERWRQINWLLGQHYTNMKEIK